MQLTTEDEKTKVHVLKDPDATCCGRDVLAWAWEATSVEFQRLEDDGEVCKTCLRMLAVDGS